MSLRQSAAAIAPAPRARSPESTTGILRTLSHDRRWRVVDLVAECDGCTVGFLCRQLAAVETGRTETTVEAEEAIALDLHHRHLPRLDAVDAVTYRPHEDFVDVGASTDAYAAVVATAFRHAVAQEGWR